MDFPKGHLVDRSTGRPWAVPFGGRAVIEVEYLFDAPSVEDVGSDEGIENIIDAIREAKSVDQKELIFQQATNSPYFFLTADQGQLLFDEVQGLNRSLLDVIAAILVIKIIVIII